MSTPAMPGGTEWTVSVVVDTKNIDRQITNANSRVDEAAKRAQKLRGDIGTIFSYMTHGMNIILTESIKAAEGTAMQADLQKMLNIEQFAAAEFSIGLTTWRAYSDFATGTPWGIAKGAAQLSIAALMQASLIQSKTRQIELDRVKSYAKQQASLIRTYTYGSYNL